VVVSPSLPTAEDVRLAGLLSPATPRLPPGRRPFPETTTTPTPTSFVRGERPGERMKLSGVACFLLWLVILLILPT